MAEQAQDADMEMAEAQWEGGDDLDEEFRHGDCVEVELGSDDEPPAESDDDGIEDDNPDEEVGVIDERQIYDDGMPPDVDDSLTSVAHQESVLSVALCPTNRHLLLTGGQDDVAVLWQLEEQAGAMRCTERFRLAGHTDSVVQVGFSNDGKYAATGSYDGTVRIWDPESGSLVHTLEGPSKEIEWILWHPKGHAILAGSADTMAWMWWAPTGKLMQIFAGHAQSVTCGCWGLGGKIVCTGSEDRGVIAWDPRAGTPTQHIRQVHESSILTMCAHPDAPIVVTGSEDAVARVVQIETGKVLANLGGHVDSVESVAFNNPAPGAMLLLATGSMDGKVMIWDGKTFDLRCTIKEHFERGGITKFKWLPPPAYGSWLCTCSTDNTLGLFNALSGECLRTLHGHQDTVLDCDLAIGAVAAGPQLYVVSGSEDNTCRIFTVALWTAGESAAHPPPSAASEVAPSQRPQQLPTSPTSPLSPTAALPV